VSQPKLKQCPRGAQTCALPLFYDRDLEINPMTLKLKGDLAILKMYLHTENEAASFIQNLELELNKEKIKYVSRWFCIVVVKVKMSKAPNYFERYRNRYSDQAPVISDQ